MDIQLQHLRNARSHAEKAREAATLELGKALGAMELLAELEVLLAQEPEKEEELAPEDHDFILKKPDKI